MKKLLILLLCIFTTNSFASGIASNSASAPCTNNTLETYSGNSNLSADWQPNTINLTWYNEQEKLTVQQSAQSCVYDGTLNVPSTPPTRTGYTFAGWKVRLPGTYTELEYIESTGTQWINTNFFPDNNTRIRTKGQFDSIENNEALYFGSAMSANNGFEGMIWDHKFAFCYGASWAGCYRSDISLNDIVEVDWNKNILNFKINNGNIIKRVFQSQTFTLPYQMRLFSLSRGFEDNVSYGSTKMKIYYFQLYDNGTLVRDFIPARRNSDGVVGMYDIVNQTFYTNPGGTNFVAGPVVQ